MKLPESGIISFENLSYSMIFAQVYLKGFHPYLVLDDDDNTHGKMLERFLNEHEIPFDTRPVRPYYPNIKGNDYLVVGMGMTDVFMSGEKKSFKFYADSYDYSMNPNEKHAQKLMEVDNSLVIRIQESLF